jgi:hypothetical protein
MLLALTITVYYSGDLEIIRTGVIIGLTALATSIVIIFFNKTLNSKHSGLNILGIITFIGLNGFNVYIILATTATNTTVEKTNLWAI